MMRPLMLGLTAAKTPMVSKARLMFVIVSIASVPISWAENSQPSSHGSLSSIPMPPFTGRRASWG